MSPLGYDFTGDDLTQLLLRKFYPERTDRESGVIRDWLRARGADYDRFSFSVRIGEGLTPDPTHLPGVQQQVRDNSRKRIDILAWRGSQPAIIEVKERVTPASLGQILTYRLLFMQENPDAPEPELVVIGRYSDPDTLASLTAHGITVHLYDPAVPEGLDVRGGV